ncbi:DivIVA domain-containing protein [Lacisediminihabitans profunda]|uniref:Cell wall synthesis protein Wag31 n=1 Tax=Lacisediminihabitans profunda TaxID=2594790 RepID=A0A5C8UT24_9MICO|nr:DivIVA domain-containing protein [Lacisediminihabitans profunda]TXN30688.1 DivIVA domain-containing protein [Lacisediminihabitans profunda]
MALTPEDVVNKRFQPTKFREGYDQDEVDDFLDEVVVELRRLNQENEELRQRLIASDARISELQRAASGPAAVEAAPQPQFASAPAVVAAAPVVAAPAPYQASDPNAIDPSNTNNLLQLARKLHEEHVREGIEKRDALIAEGHATAARIVSEAEEAQRTQINALDQQRVSLETRIEELRTFEREYRQKLKSYIEGQLHELEATEVTSNSAASAVAPGSASFASASFDSGPVDSAPVDAVPFDSAPFNSQTPPPASYQGFGGN